MVDTRIDSQTLQKVYKHIQRYRITTPQVLRRRFFPERDLASVRKICQKLRQAGDLDQGWLWRDQPYYALTPRVAREVFQERAAGALRNQQPLVLAYAMLALCCLADTTVKRRKLSSIDLRRRYPEISLQGAPEDHLYLQQGCERLTWLIVDGSAPKPIKATRIRNRVHQFVRKKREHAAWREMLDQDALSLAIATAWESKAEVITEVLSEQEQPIPYEVHVVSDLRHLISASPKEADG